MGACVNTTKTFRCLACNTRFDERVDRSEDRAVCKCGMAARAIISAPMIARARKTEGKGKR
jgi:hypothetical protein